MKHFLTGKVRGILIAAALLTALLLVVGNVAGSSFAGKIVQGALTPVKAGARALTAQAEKLYSYMFRYESLEAENQALRQQISQLQENARTADSLSRENERLRALLELTQNRDDMKLVDGYVISWSSGDWTSTFTINRGTAAGVQEGMCAITGDGAVVGLVTEAGSNYAVVKSVLDSSLEISATIASSGNNGMVQGGYTSGSEGLLRMNYLPSDAVIRNNDQVITTGSTVYPRGLVLGYVVDADFDDTGVAKFAMLRPAAELEDLEQVFIITAYNVGS